MDNYDFVEWMNAFDKALGKTSKFGKASLNYEVQSDDKCITIKIEQPGMNKKNTSIDIRDNIMRISVNIDCEKSVSLRLSKNLDLENVDAKCNDGILTICIDKKETGSIKVHIK